METPKKQGNSKQQSPGLVSKLLKGETDNTLIQLFRYLQVAFVAFAVDIGSLYAFTEFAGLHYLVSAALAFVLGVTTNYLLSIRWVFKKSSLRDRRAEAAIFVAIGVAGLGLNELFMWLFTEIMFPRLAMSLLQTPTLTEADYMLSKVLSTGLVFFFNFFVRKFLLFNKKNS